MPTGAPAQCPAARGRGEQQGGVRGESQEKHTTAVLELQRLHGNYFRGGKNVDDAIFVPDLVMVAQKFTQRALSPAQRLLHADAFHFESHLRVVSIQKFCHS